MTKPALLAAAMAVTASGALAQNDAAFPRRYNSPEYPAIPDAPAAAGTSIRAPGTRLAIDRSTGPGTVIPDRDAGPRPRRDP